MADPLNIIPSFTGGDYGRSATANKQPFKGIVIHVAGKPDLQSELDYSSHPDPNRPGYYGYHYLIDRDGTVYQTAPNDARTNHIMPNSKYGLNNNNSLGVSFIGGAPAGKDPLPLTPAQINNGTQLVNQLKQQYSIDTVVNHGALDPDTRGPGHHLGPDNAAEGADFMAAYNKSQPSAQQPATSPAMGMTINTTGPGRPGSFGRSGVELLNAELAKRGIGPDAAAGAIAGIMGESGANLSPTAFNTKDPGGGSGGIAQWNRTRLVGDNGMLAFAKNAGVDVDVSNPLDAKKVPLAIQAQYLGHELDTTYSGVADQLKGAKTSQDALNIWVNSYENPADKRAAIAQRTQYLAPVATALAAPDSATAAAPAAAAGPPNPFTAFAPGGAAAPGGAVASSLTNLDKAMGGQQPGQQQQGGHALDMQASPTIPGPGAVNVSPLFNPVLGQQMMAQLSRAPARPAEQAPIGTTLNSMAMLDTSPVQFPQVYPSQMGYGGMGSMSMGGYPSSGGYGYG